MAAAIASGQVGTKVLPNNSSVKLHENALRFKNSLQVIDNILRTNFTTKKYEKLHCSR